MGPPACARDVALALYGARATTRQPPLGAPIGHLSWPRHFIRGKGRKTNREYLDNILEQGHGSVLEHSNFGFIFTGVSRSLSHELVRHRHLSFSQLSQRYVDESDVAFVMPPAIQGTDFEGYWKQAIAANRDYYKGLVDKLTAKGLSRKQAREAARSVLPNCTETKIFVTGNARALRSFLELRASAAADAEIRRLANRIYEILVVAAPNLFYDYELVANADDILEAKTPHQRV